MSLLDADGQELERLGPENVRSKLAHAGADWGAIVPGLGTGTILCGDVEDWLAELGRESAKREADVLFFNKAAAWMAGLALLFATIFTLLDKLAG
jgi:hypothetical protein